MTHALVFNASFVNIVQSTHHIVSLPMLDETVVIPIMNAKLQGFEWQAKAECLLKNNIILALNCTCHLYQAEGLYSTDLGTLLMSS